MSKTLNEIKAQLKAKLKGELDGKFMIREDKMYRGLIAQGIHTLNVYYDDPRPSNQRAIKASIETLGYTPTNQRIYGGTYGYIISFKTHVISEKA